MADLKGMKIRVQQSDVWVAMMRAIGANATPMPSGEIFTGLKTGLIDGAENNRPSFQSIHHYEVANNYTLTEHSMAPEVLLMSKRVYDGFTPDEQKTVRKAAKDSCRICASCGRRWRTNPKPRSRKPAAQSSAIDKAPFQAAMKPVYDQFVTDPRLKAMLTRIKDEQKE